MAEDGTTTGVAEDNATSNGMVAFADDDLGRIQDLLLGQHARRTAERLDTLEQALLGVIDDLRTEMRDEFKAVDKKLTSETKTREKALANLGDRVTADAQKNAESMQALKGELDLTDNRVDAAVESLSGNISSIVAAARSDLSTDIDSLRDDVYDSKVDRVALAELFQITAAKLSE